MTKPLPDLHFRRAVRGYIVAETNTGGLPQQEWAFDKIKDLADWLVENYT